MPRVRLSQVYNIPVVDKNKCHILICQTLKESFHPKEKAHKQTNEWKKMKCESEVKPGTVFTDILYFNNCQIQQFQYIYYQKDVIYMDLNAILDTF